MGNSNSTTLKTQRHRGVDTQNVMKRALLIGCNYTGTENQLNGCINDILAIKHYLTQQSGFKESDITMLSDHVGAKSNELPTKRNMIRAINTFVSNLPTNCKVKLFFHYSGHGGQTLDRNGDEDTKYDQTLIPLDFRKAGEIVDDDLKMYLVDPLPPNVELYCIFDCCHSGTALDLRYNLKALQSGNSRQYIISHNKTQPNTAAKVILFSGCKDEQTSADAYIEMNEQEGGVTQKVSKYSGAMTWAFLETLKNNEYKPITYKTFIAKLQKLLKQNNYDQIPQLSSGTFIDLKNEFDL